MAKIALIHIGFSKKLVIKFNLNRNQNSFLIFVQSPEKKIASDNHYSGLRAKQILI